MSRKFNIGRQNDLLLNDKMHDLYTHLEFINYKDGDGNIITMPRQTKQTAIPTGALWLQHPLDSNTHKLRVHTNPTAANIEDRWPCLFEGYYHPASITGQEPENPVHGQIWINDQNVLFVRDNSGVTPRWNPVATKVLLEEDSGYFVGMDYQSIDPLLPLNMGGDYTGDPIYSVPFESFGKFYAAKNHEDEYVYCHPPINESLQVTPYYDRQGNEGAISITDDNTEAYEAKKWIHINPYNLNKVVKRLIKINKPRTYYKRVDLARTRNRQEVEVDKILLVVANDTSLKDIDPDTMIKERLANKNKYTQGIDFVPGDYVQPIIVSDQNTGFVPVPAGTTEYFVFRSAELNSFDDYDNRIGRILKCYSIKEGSEDPSISGEEDLSLRNDYEIKNGGIQLAQRIIEEYDYVYTITYEFKPQHSVDGNLIRITKTTLEGPDQIYIGACSGVPVVFMDGLYLEHYHDNGSSVYTYDDENITFAGNDVLDNMQILVVSFPQVNTFYDQNNLPHPQEYTISESNIVNRYSICDANAEGALRVVKTPLDNTAITYDAVVAHTPDLKERIDDSGEFYVRISEQRDAVVQGSLINGKWDSLFDKEKFPNPLIFYNGLAGYTYAAFPKEGELEDGEVDIHIDYEGKNITIHNFGPICDSNGMSAVFAVSLGENNYKSSGILEGGVIYDPNISVETPYLVIVDGIVMSPYNEDITVEDGKITITDATIALNSEYTVIELTDINESLIDDTDAIICIYDDMFTPYSIPIMNPKAMNTRNAYDDCDSAVVMCGPGVLLDREAIQREFDANDSFVGGQIVRKRKKTANDDELYEWRMYTYSNEYVVLDPIDDGIIISDCERMITYYMNKGTVLLNPVNIDDQPVTVYAYTYVDHIDERLLRGQRLIPIEVPNHSNNLAGYTTYTTNRTHLYDVGANALSTYINGVMVNHTEEPTTDNKGDLFFVDEQFSSKFINEYGEDMYNVLMANGFDEATSIEDQIEIATPYGDDPCLIMKYFNSEHQLAQAKALKKYILEDMRNNNFMYIIENVENNESATCRRHWAAPRNDNGNLPNSYTTSMRLMPGIINVYVNGVLLEKDEYAIFDSNKVMIGFDLIGGQEIIKKIKDQYSHPYRVLTDEGFVYIDCESDDEVMIEVRDDLSVKKRSYTIKEISYETYSFDTLDYDFPSSLSTTRDVIKIYINGVLYDGDYTNNEGVITLLDCELEEDPLYKYLKMNPSMMDEYNSKYGEYIKHEDIITFEWR